VTFQRACAVSEVASGTAVATDLEVPTGNTVAVVRNGDDWYAVDDECSHAAIPLSEGDVEGCEIECWLHGSRFDLRTGKPTSLPAIRPIAVYPVRLAGDLVVVDVEAPLTPEQIAAQILETTAVKEH
jgi:3-phenylpropionate/trans-cinnamate dioxygenase ferredoxin subunit